MSAIDTIECVIIGVTIVQAIGWLGQVAGRWVARRLRARKGGAP